jgi:DNA-directed RNA polymerase specialized sigma24 family protein
MQKQSTASTKPENGEMQSVFITRMERLLLPAYFLTGSHELAAESFLEAWENCDNTAPVAAAWQFRVAKRAVIKAALRRISADVANSLPKGVSEDRAASGEEGRYFRDRKDLNSSTFRRAFLRLNPFQRAVLLLRIYEGFSSADAALLLGASRQMLEKGLRQAFLALLGRLEQTQAGEPVLIGTADASQQVWKREVVRIPNSRLAY